MFGDTELLAVLDDLKRKILSGSITKEERLCLMNLQSKLFMLTTKPQFLETVDIWDCVSLGFLLQFMACQSKTLS
jgi:hypothetical protein